MREYVLDLLAGLLRALLGMALFATTFFLGGAAVFRVMKHFHVGCVPWPDVYPPEYSCDTMGYVIPVLLGGFLAGLFTITAALLLPRKFRIGVRRVLPPEC